MSQGAARVPNMNHIRYHLLFNLAILVISGFQPLWAQDEVVPVVDIKKDASVSIKYVISEPCALVCFVGTLSKGDQAPWIKNWYETQCLISKSFSTKNDKQILNEYLELIQRNNNQSAFEDPTGRRLSLAEKMITIASQTSELSAFLERIRPLVKDDDYKIVKNTLQHFSHPYEKLIWQPRLTRLRMQQSEFEQKSAEFKMTDRLMRVLRFMNPTWQPNLPFKIVLLPLPEPPGKNKSTGGQSFGSIQTVELLPDTTFRKKGDVIFHELCHALWFSKPEHTEFEKLFRVSEGSLPMTELYEGMATSIAQGWFAKEAFGKSPKTWYGDSIIDRYARSVEPLYSSYLNSNKEIDLSFAEQSTKIYFEKFGSATRDIRSCSGFLLISEQELSDVNEFRQVLSKLLPRSRELSITINVDSQESRDAFQGTSAKQTAILLSSSELEKLISFGVSSTQIEILKKQPNGATNIQVGDKKILVCKADNLTDQRMLLLNILSRRQWPRP
jgi:hypothetical protein